MVNVQPDTTLHSRYIMKKKLDEGGMGVVYLATDRLTGKDVALKQVKMEQIGTTADHSTLSDSIDSKNALAQEFRSIASIRHPNIISVLDYGFLNDGSPFFTMDFMEEFSDFVSGGVTKSVPEKIELVIELLNTLEYLHRRGLLHRDIKPGNVALYQEHVKLLDFGLSIDSDSLQTDEDNMKIVGTIAYMAPEVLQGQKPTPASDLYAVGIMAYELFVGEHPFNLKNMNMLIMDVISTMPDLSTLETIDLTDAPLSARDADEDTEDSIDVTAVVTAPVSTQPSHFESGSESSPKGSVKGNQLRNVVYRLLVKSASDRYQNAVDVVHELNFILERSHIHLSDTARDSYLRSAKFVGREKEMGILQDAMEDTARKHGSAWLIGGEAGVGKTRLIDELRVYALIKGYTVVSGYAVADNNIPYQLWRDPVRRLLLSSNISDVDASVLKDLVSDIERLLEKQIPDPDPLDGEKHKERLQSSILSLFQDVRAPLLLILEDIQWSTNSIDTLNRLSSIISDKRIMVIATFRQDEDNKLAQEIPDFHFLELKRLSRNEIQRLGEGESFKGSRFFASRRIVFPTCL